MVYHTGYDSFGDPINQSGSGGDRFMFAGQEYDAVTGLYYDRARFYDAATGRFTGRDPSGFAGRDQNLYRYVSNAPTDGTDPLGFQGQGQAQPSNIFNDGWELYKSMVPFMTKQQQAAYKAIESYKNSGKIYDITMQSAQAVTTSQYIRISTECDAYKNRDVYAMALMLMHEAEHALMYQKGKQNTLSAEAAAYIVSIDRYRIMSYNFHYTNPFYEMLMALYDANQWNVYRWVAVQPAYVGLPPDKFPPDPLVPDDEP